jgi:phosphoribosylanthranilate isomerase
MIVQLYEIQSPGEAETCIELGVHHIGSVLLSQDQWRQPELRDLIDLSRGTHTKNTLLPLFQDMETLCRAIEYYHPHFIHFCETLTDPNGRELPLDSHIRRQQELKYRFPEVGIIRSLPIPSRSAPDFPLRSLATRLVSHTDLFLADTWAGQEPVSGYIGITGQTLDWQMARELMDWCPIPVILAGGLSPENVGSAIRAVLPAGVDSCTQTNQTDKEGRPVRFKKDFQKVATFIARVRDAEEEIRRRQETLSREVNELEAELRERKASFPSHSPKPQHLIALEDLEEAISSHRSELERLKRAVAGLIP